jgi:hypothetical protein
MILGRDSSVSPVIPISFLATLLCVLLAIDWPMFQQVMFVGAAAAATVFFCYLEGLGLHEQPVRTEEPEETLR